MFICVSVLGEFGIAQHGLKNAVKTAAVFCKTMITSCPASAVDPTPPPPLRGLCVGVRLQICVASLHMERNASCIRFFQTCKGLPLLRLGLWKIPEPLTAATQRRHFEIEQRLRNSAEDGGRYTYIWGDYLTVGNRRPLVYFIVRPCFIHLKL